MLGGRCRWLGTFAMAVVLAWGPVAAALPADDEDARFLEGLRARRMYRLAEAFCRQRLAESDLAPRQRAELAVEQIHCCIGQALESPAAERDRWWQQARAMAADFLAREPSQPSAFLVRVQDGLTLLARGQSIQQEAELDPAAEASWELVLSDLREASRLFEAIEAELAVAIPTLHRRSPGEGELSAAELVSLQHQLRYHLARCCRIRGACYPPGSDDRIALMTQAAETIQSALTQLGDADALAGPLRLELAATLRQSGEPERARQALEPLGAVALADACSQSLAAESARIELASGQPRKAIASLDAAFATIRQPAADLELCRLETLLALCSDASAAGDEAGADAWRKQAVAAVRLIEQHHGPAWGRRAELALLHVLGAQSAAGDADVLLRTADDLYRRGRLDEALAAYERAGEAADRGGQAELAFDLRYKAGLVDQARSRHAAAAQRFSALARGHAAHPRAAAVHLLAAWNLAQQARDEPGILEAYGRALGEQIRSWPPAKESDTARIWLGRLRQSQGDWQAALEAYGGIAADGEHAAEAIAEAAVCWNQLLEQAASGNGDPGSLASGAAEFFESRIARPLADPQAGWRPQDRACALQVARVRLRYEAGGSARAESVLRAGLAGSPSPEDAWREQANALLVVALGGQPAKISEAEAVLAELGAGSADSLLAVLRAVEELARSAGDPRRRELAELRLAILGRIDAAAAALTAEQRADVARARAEAIRDAGRQDDAISAFAALVRAQPDDPEVEANLARLLLEAGDPAQRQESLDRWRRIASRSRTGSDLWYEARYSAARALMLLGQPQEAAERIRYLQLTAPGFDQSAWKERLLDLLRQCESSGGRP